MPTILNNGDMIVDKYKALWLSHSSLGDFQKCPRLYYFKNIYKDKYARKIDIPSPYKSLGIAIHEVVENLANTPSNIRLDKIQKDLLNDYKNNWQKYSGKIGGFTDDQQENIFYERGVGMINNIIENPELFLKKVIQHKSYNKSNMITNIVLSTAPDIILCGNIDWIRYNDEDDTISIIDFKTGTREESQDSTQLAIYYLLLSRLQKRVIRDAYYLYLDKSVKEEDLKEYSLNIVINNIEDFVNNIIEIGNKIIDCKKNNLWECSKKDGDIEECIHCKDYEKIISNSEEIEYLGQGPYNKSLYSINRI